MDLPVGDGHVFGSKEVSWIPLSVTVTFLDQSRSLGPPCEYRSRFWIKGSQLDLPVGDGHVFGSKVVSWIPLSMTSRFLDQRRSVGSFCW